MAKWQPFLIISKKDLGSGKDEKSELKNGLPSLTRRLKESGLIQAVWRIIGEYQFHWPSGKLVDKNGGTLTLPPRFERVIREMVEKDPRNPRAVKAELNYNEVAMKYVEGCGIEKRANMDESEVRAWIAQKGSQIADDPTPLAHQFARDFRRFLKSHGIMDSKAIIECDKKNQLYRLGKSWHRKPVLDHSEPDTEKWLDLPQKLRRRFIDDVIDDDPIQEH